MYLYPTIQELIDSVNDKEVSYRSLHTNIYLKNKDTIIKIPYKSIINQYRPYFKSTIVEAKLGEQEATMYRFRPKYLSYNLYGTTELWSALLEINDLISILDFDLETYKLFNPKPFKIILNEILIQEGILT